jgi:hypothetical protein
MLSMSKEVLTVRTETSSSTSQVERSIRNGMSSMLMRTRKSQRKVNSTKTSACT